MRIFLVSTILVSLVTGTSYAQTPAPATPQPPAAVIPPAAVPATAPVVAAPQPVAAPAAIAPAAPIAAKSAPAIPQAPIAPVVPPVDPKYENYPSEKEWNKLKPEEQKDFVQKHRQAMVAKRSEWEQKYIKATPEERTKMVAALKAKREADNAKMQKEMARIAKASKNMTPAEKKKLEEIAKQRRIEAATKKGTDKPVDTKPEKRKSFSDKPVVTSPATQPAQ